MGEPVSFVTVVATVWVLVISPGTRESTVIDNLPSHEECVAVKNKIFPEVWFNNSFTGYGEIKEGNSAGHGTGFMCFEHKRLFVLPK
jgi:hypothetical protein